MRAHSHPSIQTERENLLRHPNQNESSKIVWSRNTETRFLMWVTLNSNAVLLQFSFHERTYDVLNGCLGRQLTRLWNLVVVFLSERIWMSKYKQRSVLCLYLYTANQFLFVLFRFSSSQAVIQHLSLASTDENLERSLWSVLEIKFKKSNKETKSGKSKRKEI